MRIPQISTAQILGGSLAIVMALACSSCQSGNSSAQAKQGGISSNDAAAFTAQPPQTPMKVISSPGVQIPAPGENSLAGPNASAVGSTPAMLTASTPPPAAKPAAPPEDVVVPPRNAKWTLLITQIDGPDHVARAKSLRDQLKSVTQDNKWYVVHEAERSTVYYGFYHEIDRQTPDGQAAQREKERLSNLHTTTGDSPLTMIYFVPVTTPDPPAPAEWDLAKIGRSPQHFWSIQIAAYTEDGRAETPGDVGDRKSAAVESVKALRATGVPAYFYHGSNISVVCVGLWPEAAVKKQSGGDAAGNAATVNPNQPLLVTDDLPSNLKEVRTKDGQLVKVLTPRIEILDSDLLNTWRKYPYHSRNGYDYEHTYVDEKTHQKVTVREPSSLVQLPDITLKTNPNQPFGGNNADLQIAPGLLGGANNAQSQDNGLGKLRSIGQ